MAPATDCVLVIHGTWNRPEAGKPPKWFQLCPADEHNFCTRLTKHLKTHGMAEAVWQGHEPGHEFCWTGENAHEDRLHAAQALCNLFVALTDQTPRRRVHVVAHSHGGNVLLKAIELYYMEIWKRALPDAERVERFRRWLKDSTNRHREAPTELQRFMSTRLEQHSVLGRLVFLGTPFLEKRWEAPTGRLDWILTNTIAALRALPTIGMGMYVGGLVWAYIIAAVIKAAGWVIGRPWLENTWPALNPFQWYTSWQVVFGVYLVTSFFMLFFERSRWDSNYYFDARMLSRRFGSKVPRMPALIVTARYLDEALLFLSAEPLAHVFVVSRVLNRLRGSLQWKVTKQADGLSTNRVGENPEALRTGGTVLVDFVATIVGWLLKLVAAPIWWAVRKAFLDRAATRLVIDALESAAFGLPMEEVRDAHVEVKEQPGAPAFFAETLWRTQNLALSAPAHARTPGDAADRYAHLIDEQVLKHRRECEEEKGKTAENTWSRLLALAPTICRARNPTASQQEIDAYTEHLARLWFTLEARASELGGSVELVHSLYYSNEPVVAAVAAFLATGEKPANSLSDADERAIVTLTASAQPLDVASASGNVSAV